MCIRVVLVCLLLGALSACGDSDNGAAPVAPPASNNPPPPTAPTPQTGTVTVTISIPLGTSAPEAAAPAVGIAAQRKSALRAAPKSYVSPKTKSVLVSVTAVDGVSPTGIIATAVEVAAGSNCTAVSGALNCTISLAAPVGNDTFDVSTWATADQSGQAALSKGTATAQVPADGNVSLTVELLAVVADLKVEITPAAWAQPINVPGTFTARIRGVDVTGDIITGTTNYHDPIVITSKDFGPHLTASPALPATFTSPAQDTITFDYDGAGTAASYGFSATPSQRPTYYLTLEAGEHLYVSLADSNTIAVYDIQADGSLTGPSRTLSGADTGLNHPTSI